MSRPMPPAEIITQRNGNGTARLTNGPSVGTAEDLSTDLASLVDDVSSAAERWREMLSVSIGRASVLTTLKEAQIRYFEDLGALQPTKATDQPGASRLYTLTDLRRLYALALLLKQRCRPAEAAEIVKQHAEAIEHGRHQNITDLLVSETGAVADGFVLARLTSQLIDATHEYFNEQDGYTAQGSSVVQVRELLLPLRPLLAEHDLSRECVQQAAHKLHAAPMDVLVALLDPGDRSLRNAPLPHVAGRNDRTVLFYSRELYALPPTCCQFCVYVPQQQPQRVLFLGVETCDEIAIAPVLQFGGGTTRTRLFDTILELCEHISVVFRHVSLAKNYRYRSDGFDIAQTSSSYARLLATLRRALFGNDAQTVVAMLIPNDLARPGSLALLAYDGLLDELTTRTRVSLHGEGQGLSGRAYLLREPFFSLDARHDPRAAHPLEETRFS